jgi:alpha/beta superfamily hydrolase
MTAFDFGSAFVVRYLLHRCEADHLAASRSPASHDSDRNADENDVRADEIQQGRHTGW